mmetsp:Transcript_16006/g.34668  ORF Transcript_16006/g.34668 Transcript_16006/m.34668 type:complete len:210 (+) Transcript_16006:792-1421(+)
MELPVTLVLKDVVDVDVAVAAAPASAKSCWAATGSKNRCPCRMSRSREPTQTDADDPMSLAGWIKSSSSWGDAGSPFPSVPASVAWSSSNSSAKLCEREMVVWVSEGLGGVGLLPWRRGGVDVDANAGIDFDGCAVRFAWRCRCRSWNPPCRAGVRGGVVAAAEDIDTDAVDPSLGLPPTGGEPAGSTATAPRSTGPSLLHQNRDVSMY